MREPAGHVSVNERMPSQRFQRYVSEKIKDWMRDHDLSDEDLTDYDVAFFDEDSLGEVSCLVVIHAGGHQWRSWETGDNPRVALDRTIEQLREHSEHESEAESRIH